MMILFTSVISLFRDWGGIKKIVLVSISVALYVLINGQTQGKITFLVTSGGRAVRLNTDYRFPDPQKGFFTLEKVQFYISNLQLLNGHIPVFTDPKKHRLIDLEKRETWEIETEKGFPDSFDQVRFQLGIDSATNVSGAHGGDLDPTNGMYWTWHSGYINVKMEGRADECQGRNNRFQLHLGGYLHPYPSITSISLKSKPGKHIMVELPMDKILDRLDLKSTYEVMSPGKNAVTLSALISSQFKLRE